MVLVNYFVCEWCNWHHMCWDWEQNDCCHDNLVYAVFLVSENSSNSWMSRAQVDYLHESYLLISPCRPQMPQTKRLWHLLKVLRNHQWASRTLLYLFQLNSLLQPKSKHFAKWVYFSACIFSSCFHLQLSFSFCLAFSLCPSLQLHHSYPALAPAVTLKQLSTVTMVMHTTVLDFCCHLIIIIITVTTVNVRLRDLSQSSDPSLICIMWRMALMLSRDKLAGFHAWVKNDQQMWSSVIEKNWNTVIGKGDNVQVCACVSCLLPGALPPPPSPDYQQWRIYFFFSLSCRCELLPVCVYPGWPTEVFPPASRFTVSQGAVIGSQSQREQLGL